MFWLSHFLVSLFQSCILAFTTPLVPFFGVLLPRYACTTILEAGRSWRYSIFFTKDRPLRNAPIFEHFRCDPVLANKITDKESLMRIANQLWKMFCSAAPRGLFFLRHKVWGRNIYFPLRNVLPRGSKLDFGLRNRVRPFVPGPAIPWGTGSPVASQFEPLDLKVNLRTCHPPNVRFYGKLV